MNTLSVIVYDGMYMFWLCLLLHFIADFKLQGCLANLKQVWWWLEEVQKRDLYDKWGFYKHDYLMGLLCHSFMWSLITFIPLMLVIDSTLFTVVILINTILHAYADNEKANRLSINLWTDQLSHLLQITGTLGVLYATVL